MQNSGQQPYDELGGQYASFSGGTPGFDWGGLGQGIGAGFSAAGKSLQNSPQMPAGTSYGISDQTSYSHGQSDLAPTIPSAGGSNEIVQLLQRLLGSGTGGY